MPTFHYAKLVRDNIPRWHREAGHAVVGRRLEGIELFRALIKKLREEVDEVDGALSRSEFIDELGDVQQVLSDLCFTQGITHDELMACVREKTEYKGGFSRGEYIETVTISREHDKWAEYCRASPDKYPEIK